MFLKWFKNSINAITIQTSASSEKQNNENENSTRTVTIECVEKVIE